MNTSDVLNSIKFSPSLTIQKIHTSEYEPYFNSVHEHRFSSVAQSCLTLCDPMDCSTPGLPVHHQLLEPDQTHVHWVSDAIQPSYPLSSLSPPAFNLSQYQGLFQWVSSSHQVARVLEFQLQHQSFRWIFRTDFLYDWLVWYPWYKAGKLCEAAEGNPRLMWDIGFLFQLIACLEGILYFQVFNFCI